MGWLNKKKEAPKELVLTEELLKSSLLDVSSLHTAFDELKLLVAQNNAKLEHNNAKLEHNNSKLDVLNNRIVYFRKELDVLKDKVTGVPSYSPDPVLPTFGLPEPSHPLIADGEAKILNSESFLIIFEGKKYEFGFDQRDFLRNMLERYKIN